MVRNLENFTENIKIWRKIAWIVSASFVLIMLYNLFTGDVFMINDANQYIRGRNYSIFLIPTGILLSINILIIWRFHHYLPDAIKSVAMAIAFLPVFSCTLHIIFVGMPFIQLCCFILSVLVFFNTQAVFAERLQMQQRREIEQEHRILIAQLQPHFLYNALLAIMGIDGNPPETIEAITSFSKYLRGSLNSLKEEDIIPAEQELNHVKAYVQLEQLRYDGKLKIKMNIQESGFYLPPLSLQMLVENAIRHGFHGMETPGSIYINSIAKNGFYIVTIEDDGCGFDVNTIFSEDKRHVGLNSVKRRIEMMCQGQLIVRSTPGEGTCIKILIPKKVVKEKKRNFF